MSKIYGGRNYPYWRRVDAFLPDCPPAFRDWLDLCLTRNKTTLSLFAHRRALLVAAVYLDIYDDESYALDAALMYCEGKERLVCGASFLTYVRVLPASRFETTQ